MGSNQERYFFLSGLISFSFFIVLVGLVGYSLIISPKIEQFSMIQSDVINVSITISETKETEQSLSEAIITPIEPEVAEKQNELAKPEPVPEISDLFAQVKIDKTPKKKPEENKELNALEKEILERKDVPRFSDKIKSIKILKGGSTGPMVDKYYAMIFAFVSQNFNPPLGTVGNKATVVLVLSPSGKLRSFKILYSSKNQMFDEEVDRLKDKMAKLNLPAHPDGDESELRFELMKTLKE